MADICTESNQFSNSQSISYLVMPRALPSMVSLRGHASIFQVAALDNR